MIEGATVVEGETNIATTRSISKGTPNQGDWKVMNPMKEISQFMIEPRHVALAC